MSRCLRICCITVLACFLLNKQVLAAVRAIDASAEAEVNEYIGSETVNYDSALKKLGETTPNLPLVAEAHLQQSNVSGEVTGAAATTTVSDPRISQLPNPEEFGMALGGISRMEQVTYGARCTAYEIREVEFTASDIGTEQGAALEARSYFYLDGILVIWSQSDSQDLGQTSAGVSLEVQQTRLGDGEPQTLLKAGLSLDGREDGTAELNTDGAIADDNVILQDVSDWFPELGRAHLVILPDMAIPYTYESAVGEVFTLKARLEGSIVNQKHAGAAVLLGVPLPKLAGVLTDTVGQDVGQGLGSYLVDLLSKRPVAEKSLSIDDRDTKVTVKEQSRLLPWAMSPWCGPLGVESIACIMVMGVSCFYRRWG